MARRSQKIRGRSSTDLTTSLYDHVSIQIPSHTVLFTCNTYVYAMEEILPYHLEPEYSDREDLDDDHDVVDSHSSVSRPYSRSLVPRRCVDFLSRMRVISTPSGLVPPLVVSLVLFLGTKYVCCILGPL